MEIQLMRGLQGIIALVCWLCISVPDAMAVEPVRVIAISWHDVRDSVDADIDPDTTAVSSRKLAEQFEWLRQNGYQPVSIDQLQHASTRPLPDKAVLLTFDDGYQSFYTRIFPLLKLYHYPAVMALVGSWLDVPAGNTVQYGDEKVPRDHFLTDRQIREMQQSGLVEFASHSYDLHKGVQGNPQGNMQPATVTALYDTEKHSYESVAAMEQRIHRDLKRNHARLQQLTGVAPRVMVWPYGEWNEAAERIARDMGYDWFLLLGDQARPDLQKHRIQRHLVSANPDMDDFAAMVQPYRPPVATVRAAHVDMDYVYDSNPAQMDTNIDHLLERIKRLKISTVYLQAFADPDGDGNADALYFPSRHLPVRADVFNRVAWQLRTRAGVQVYAWMPVTAFEFGEHFYRQHGVRRFDGQGAVPSNNSYRRLSVFDQTAQMRIRDIYRDLARHASFHGLLLHDDALLDMDEDFHPAAVAYFSARGLALADYAQWRDDPARRRQFTDLKIAALNSFTRTLLQDVRQFRPEIRSARNVYAGTILNPESQHWFAQSLASALQEYDYVAVMAMPWMEKASEPAAWTRSLIAALEGLPAPDKRKLVVELQARDWRNDKPVPAADFRQQVALWKQAGYQNYAWYPDDFIANVPDFSMVYTLLSLEDYPYERR